MNDKNFKKCVLKVFDFKSLVQKNLRNLKLIFVNYARKGKERHESAAKLKSKNK